MASLTAQERKIVETLRSPMRWGEAYLRNRDGSPREYWPHQREDLLCEERNIIHLDGRAVGKCLAGDTLITDCTTGERVRMDRLRPGRAIAVLGPDQKICICKDYEVHPNGRRACWKLTTRSGRSIQATDNHPFLTDGGWVPLGGLRVGDWLAVTKHHPVHTPENPQVSDDELKLLAYFIADGGIAHASAVFTKTEPILVDEFRQCVLRLFPGIQVAPVDGISYRVTTGRRGRRNPCIGWLRRHGLMGKKSKEKFIPPILFTCSQRQWAVFLSRLFGCDGWFHVQKDGLPRIGYCSASLRLAEEVHHALLRFGIQSDLRVKAVNNVDYWCVEIRTLSHVQRFGRLIGMVGMKGIELEGIMDAAPKDAHNPWDVIPAPLVRPIVENLKRRFTWNQITGNKNRRIRLNRYNPTRALVAEYAANCEGTALHELAASDIHWDKVVAIEYVGKQETFDLSVPGYHNFVANDIIVHNSINLSTLILHYAFITHGGQGLVAAPHQGHLDTIIEEVEFQLDNNPDLMNSVALTKYGKPKIHRKPYFRLELTNGSILYFRPAGAYGDAFRSLHVDRVWVDEAAWLSEKAWKALRQCLNEGGTLRIYSTPNGLRNTTYYRLTMSEQFTVFRWPSWLNPNWSEERESELLAFYGGRDTSG